MGWRGGWRLKKERFSRREWETLTFWPYGTRKGAGKSVSDETQEQNMGEDWERIQNKSGLQQSG